MSKIFGSFKHSLGNFVFEVKFVFPGSGITVVYGPSGCGKSTFLRLIAGLEIALSGFIYFNGVCLQNSTVYVQSNKRNFSFVFQNSCFLPNLTIYANLFYGYRRCPFKSRYIDVLEVMEVFKLRNIINKNFIHLSGGEKQRIYLARSLLSNPDLLLLDEPVSALDKVFAMEVLTYLWFVNREYKIPIILVSHSMVELNFIADCYFELT
jgi:molybdate transport system ATP-binding protein